MTVVDRSRNIPEITNAMFSTNMDTLTLNVEEWRVGTITLIYGNGSNGLDVIGGHTDSPHINRLVEHTMKEFERSSTPSLQDPINRLSILQRRGWDTGGDLTASWRGTDSDLPQGIRRRA